MNTAKTWTSKTGGRPTGAQGFTLAPDWYSDAKAKGASPEELFDMVRDFCRQTMVEEAIASGQAPKEPDDKLVRLMIITYEANAVE